MSHIIKLMFLTIVISFSSSVYSLDEDRLFEYVKMLGIEEKRSGETVRPVAFMEMKNRIDGSWSKTVLVHGYANNMSICKGMLEKDEYSRLNPDLFKCTSVEF